MAFNPDKCEVIHFSTKQNTIQSSYRIHGTELSTSSSAKYLGVTMSSNLQWKHHIDSITKKAHSSLSFIRRNLSSCTPKAKTNAYFTFVRPLLEYSSTVWSPHTEELIQRIEMVQRRAARFVRHDFARESSVSAMIKEL